MESEADTTNQTLKSTRFRLTIAQKVELIDLFNEGKTRSYLSEFFNIPLSTLGTIIREQDKIRNEYESHNPNRLCAKSSPYQPLESALLKWMDAALEKNIPINCRLVQEKALELAELMNFKGFTASNGWLSRFKKRENLDFKGRNCERSQLVFLFCLLAFLFVSC